WASPEDSRTEIAVDAAEPAGVAEEIEPVGVFEVEQRLGATVAFLLVQIGPNRGTTAVPDKGGGGESNLVARVLQAPAQVDIVAGGTIDRVEQTHIDQVLAPERHVATGDVLGLPVRE